MEITEKILDEHIDKIINVVKNIKENKITVIVGQNGTGKSLIRKQMDVRLRRHYQTDRHMIRQVSQQLRTELRSDMGALACIAMDDPDSPTSMASYICTQKILDYDKDKKYYIVLDEAEIGMSEESICGFCNYLDTQIPDLLEYTLGIMIITHSSIIAEHFITKYDCDFYNIGYNSVDTDFNRWRNRTIKPTNFEWLEQWSDALFRRVQKRSRIIKDKNKTNSSQNNNYKKDDF